MNGLKDKLKRDSKSKYNNQLDGKNYNDVDL